MRILLINPPNGHQAAFAGPNQLFVQHGLAPPLGLMYLKSFLLSQTDHEVRLLNGQVPKPPDEVHIRKQIEMFHPHLVGITVQTLNLYDSLRAATLAKQVNPQVHVVLGGPHLRVYPEESLLRPEVDSVVMGDGEQTLKEMVDRLSQGRDLEGVPGTWFKRNGQLIRNPLRPISQDLDQLPFPDRSEWDLRQHRIPYDSFSPTAVMITSRGCPYQCTFCSSVDRHYRERSAQNIVEEMIRCRDLGYRSIDFYDDNFNLTEARVLRLCDEIQRRQVGVPWSCRCRVSGLTEPMVARMAETGCARIGFGVESGTQAILDQVKKNITLDEIRNAFRLSRQFGVASTAYVMLGFPGETADQIRDTIRFNRELDPDFVIFQCLVPAPGSEIYRQAVQDPGFGGDHFQAFAQNPPPRWVTRTWETAVSEKELFRLCRLAYLGFYFRPRYLFRSLRRIQSGEDFFAKARMGLKILTDRY
jgi:radical SAM superfamily enzyme YgiQ (UPF0313 family)